MFLHFYENKVYNNNDVLLDIQMLILNLYYNHLIQMVLSEDLVVVLEMKKKNLYQLLKDLFHNAR